MPGAGVGLGLGQHGLDLVADGQQLEALIAMALGLVDEQIVELQGLGDGELVADVGISDQPGQMHEVAVDVQHGGGDVDLLAVIGEAVGVLEAKVLARADFDASLPTCFVLEGLIHYLSVAALESVLAGTALCRGETHVVLTFIEADMRARASTRLEQLFRTLGETPRTFWLLPKLVARLAAHGFAAPLCWDFQQQLHSFVPPDVRRQRHLQARWWQLVLMAARPLA